MSVKDKLIGWGIRLYRRTPLCPGCGAFFAQCLSRVQGASERVVTREMDGFRISLDLTYTVDSQIYYSGVFEPATVAMLRRLVKPGDTVFDVGANIGYLSLILRTCVGDSGRVVSFEPIPQMVQRLRANIELNGFDNIEQVRAGLSDAAGSVMLALDKAIRLDGRAGEPQAVELITLDDYVARHATSRIDLIKIDTDGAEPAVLRGADQTLGGFKPVVVIELGVRELDAAAESIELLRGHGYGFFDESGTQVIDDPLGAVRSLAAGTTTNLVARWKEVADG